MGMSYKEAAGIRERGYFGQVAQKLVNKESIGKSIFGSVSDVVKAKAVGIKEKFDPLHWAKKLTGGHSIGAALLGRLTGRSQEDIEYFTGLKAKKIKIKKQLSSDDKIYTKTAKNLLVKIYNMFRESDERERKERELKRSTNELVESQKERNHRELLAIIESIGVPEEEEKKVEEKTFLEQILEKFKKAIKSPVGKNKPTPRGMKPDSTTLSSKPYPSNVTAPVAASSGASTLTKVVGELTTGKAVAIGTATAAGSFGLGAFLGKAEAKDYNTVVKNQKSPKPLTRMTLNELDDFQTKLIKKGGDSAAGKYQITRKTMRQARAILKLSGTDIFDEKMQDRIYNEFLISEKKRPKLAEYLSGKSDDIDAAQLDFAKEFAGAPVPFDLKRPPGAGGKDDPGGFVRKGQSYYHGYHGNVANESDEEFKKRLKEQRDYNLQPKQPEVEPKQEKPKSIPYMPNSPKPKKGFLPFLDKSESATPLGSNVSQAKTGIINQFSLENKDMIKEMSEGSSVVVVENNYNNIVTSITKNISVAEKNKPIEPQLLLAQRA